MKKKSIDRRVLLRWGGKSAAAAALLGACRPKTAVQSDAAPTTLLRTRGPSTHSLATPGEIASTASTPAQLDAICRRTAKDIEGPFFRESAPYRGSLIPPGSKAETILHLRGQVFDGRCQALAGSILEFWQADATGAYDHRGFHMRTRVTSDALGGYALDTIEPGRYLNGDQYRPAHIHVKVHAQGQRSLTTQLYFADDPYNRVDPWFLPALQIQEERSDKGRAGLFDFYLGSDPKGGSR